MIDFLKNGPGNCYMKLTAPYRMASEPNFEDSAIIAKAFIEAVPDKIIWGSDYPYLSNSHRVNSINLFNLIPLWIPDKATQQKILVDNPAKLFGFTV
jgi:hypothetical protein